MKHLSLMLVALFASVSFYGASQKTHFDDKPYVEGEMLVQIIDNVSLKSILNRAPEAYKLEFVQELSGIMRVSLLSFNPSAISHEGIQHWLYSQPEVSIADYNYYVEVRSTLPGDPSITQQWHHNNTGAGGGTADADIDSDLAWDITTGGTTATGDDIVVCLVEGGGGNLDHQDLDPNRWVNNGEIPGNNSDDDGNGYVDDYNGWNTGSNDDNYGNSGHGTNCLGMIGAKGNNGIAVAGANWDVKLMVVNMGGNLTQGNVVAAYNYPLVMRQMWNNSGGTEGAFVVATSASWGIDGANPNSYPIWCQFYDTLGTYGILNVGATTNQNLDVDVQGDMPTACNSDYMIGVGRTDNNDNTAGGYGDQTIELGAPGIDVVTTNGTSNGASGITTTTGTSFACPLTAGVIGLAYSIPCPDFMAVVTSNPQAAADLVLQAMIDGVDPKSQLASRFITGGRLNSRNTLDELMAVACSGTICLGPGGISTNGVTDNSVSISFTANASATATNFYWREVGAASWTQVAGATSPVNLTSLANCTDYEYYFQSICGADMSSPTATQTFSTTGCGQCIDLPYCTSAATDASDEWIESFQLGTFTNTSGNDAGYALFDSSPILLQTDNTYTVSITPEWGGTDYDEYSRVWVDLNQNGTFDSEELLYDQGTAAQTAATGSLTIPAGASLGSTRLRVQMAYQGSGQNSLPNVCGDFTWGEVEDYCVDITDGSGGGGGGAGLDALTDGTFSVYPNPTNGMVNFVITSPSVKTIAIVDLVGKVIDVKPVNAELTQFNLDTYSNGTYFYRLIDANGSTLVTEKLVRLK